MMCLVCSPMEQPRQLESEKVYYQPHLFSDHSEISTLRNEYGGLLAKLNNLRKGVFKRLDDLVKSCKEIILRQDERDLEIAKLQARLDKIEMDLLNQSPKNDNTSRMLNIVGKRKDTRSFYIN